MSKIILINGKKRSGKDFFATLLKKELLKLGKTAEIMSFADPIKDIIAISFGLTPDELDILKNEEESIITRIDDQQKILTNFRLILQNFGTEAMKKHFGEDVWSKLLLDRANSTSADFVLVPDFRFLCECLECGITVKVRNDDVQNGNDNHRSENELNDFVFDYELDNTGYRLDINDVQDFLKQLFLDQTIKELS